MRCPGPGDHPRRHRANSHTQMPASPPRTTHPDLGATQPTLRYYDQIGLLTPADVGPGSGYRRYTVDQLEAAVLIAQMRAIGMTPQIIASVLAGAPRPSGPWSGSVAVSKRSSAPTSWH